MAKLIEVKNIDETPTIIPARKDETSHSKKDLNSLEVARIPWRTYLEMQNYNKDKYKMCEICISDQKKKFGGRTPIQCTGLRDYKPILEEKYDADIIETIMEELSESELLELKAIFSPVDWFRANVHDPETYTERWYQSLTLSCSARNKVLRLGRRCIEENEQVLMANGSYKKIKNIKIGDFVISNRDSKVVTNKVTDVINNGKRNLYRIKTNDGKEVTLTEDHQVLTDNGWKSIEEGLKKGDLVSHLPKIESIETNNIDTEEAKLLGYLLTDGYLSDQFEFIKIKSITNLEVEGTVYDITVENDHNFVTNGLVVHNCGKTFSIVMDLIYRIATASRPINILVAAPLVTMIHEIEKAFKALSRVLEQENFITKSRATPTLEMTFFNGSVLQGITTNDGGKASRGKKADIIWLDETDYMDRKAIEAIEAIKLDNPNVEMFITSTPKGEGNLYEFAQQENVKEFHYPSYVIPHYDDAIDQDLRGKLSEIGFTQEVIALYGLDQDSVFQQHFIEDSYELYIPEFYNESFVLNNRDRFIVIIGVDWNHDNNGTRIIVVGYDRVADRFFCVEKKKIAKVNLTQELSVNMVVELNRKYNADHIICDEGFGIGQVSELRVRGKEQYGKVPANHPDIKLTKTESVQFGATLEIRDPTTYETLKKRTKQYIVELAQKLLEAKRLALDPANDSELIMQLKNYSIIKTGMRGNVYKAKDKKIGDHDLDGYMLALYMFDKVYGDYITPKAYEHISMMPNSNTEFYDPSRTVQKDVALFSSSNLSGKRKRFKSRRKW